MAFTSEQEDELWERWRRGEPSRLIARAVRTNGPDRTLPVDGLTGDCPATAVGDATGPP